MAKPFKSSTILKDPLLTLNKAAANPATSLKASTVKSSTNAAALPAKPPANPLAGLTGIKDTIMQYGGYKDSQVGWDQGNQNVLIDGQSLMRADTVKDGKSYGNAKSIMAAIDAYAAKNKPVVQTTPVLNAAAQAATPLPAAQVAKPTEYVSPYSSKIDSILNSLTSKQEFSYNPETDPVFQAYKTQFGIAGDKALTNTMGEASSLTGGRLNSWAVSSGSQAKAGYDQTLMDRVPELANAAYSRRQGDIQNESNALRDIQSYDNAQYGRFNDTKNFDRGVLETDRTFNRNTLESDRTFDYNKENNTKNFDRGVLESDRTFKQTTDSNKQNFDRGVLESDRTFKHTVTREKVLDDQWLKNYTSEEKQRIIANAIQNRQVSISEGNAALNRSQFAYSKEQDKREFDFKVSEAAKKTGAGADMLGAQYSDMMASPDPAAWLKENAAFLSSVELKALEGMLPKADSNAVLKSILAGEKK